MTLALLGIVLGVLGALVFMFTAGWYWRDGRKGISSLALGAGFILMTAQIINFLALMGEVLKYD